MGRAMASVLRREPPSGALAGLYKQREWRPLWLGNDGRLSRDGRRVQMLLAAAADHGLPAARYRLPPAPDSGAPAATLARYDVALSTAALRYASDMGDGLLKPTALFRDAEAEKPDSALPQKLVGAADAGRAAVFLAGLEPGGDYQRLKAALKMYRNGPEWVSVTDTSRAALPARLAAEGYLREPNLSPKDVEAALKTWQTANGIEPDGKLTEETLAALNIDRRMRAAQIAANMERWRWLPALPARYLWVNVPSAQLVLIENGQPALNSRVVVGSPKTPTPLFVTEAVAVTVNPRWHVPTSITQNELLPKLAEDPSYLSDRGIIQEDGRLVQLPGPQNALGAVKIEMPNHYNVYLHDTPAKNAFLSDERTLSHGCVRVEAIHALGMKLAGLTQEELDADIATQKTMRKPIAEKLPVFLQYWTAMPSPDGRIGFREDVYGRDAKMIAAMQQLEQEGSAERISNSSGAFRAATSSIR
jgi:murein L,D-transpeptidase YcbB/YkuD